MRVKRFSQYSDAIIIAGVLGLFVLGGVVAYQQFHSNHEEWETDFSQSQINLSSISTTGMGRDSGIIPIDNPRFVDVASAMSWLDARTPVIVVLAESEARAYPLTILLLHEIVNDSIAGLAIAVTYCPLCNSPIVYEREIDGQVLRMGVTGNLYNNNFLMYDDLTESWWHQFTGEALVGDYVGRVLRVYPSQVVAFNNFARHYPRGDVLAGDEFLPHQSYTMNPYMDYEESSSPMLNRGDYDPRLPAMERVLGVHANGTVMAYPFSDLEDVGAVNDQIGGSAIVVFWQPGAASALDGLTIQNSRDVGQAAIFGRMVDGRELHFTIVGERIIDTETQSEWNIFGEAIEGYLKGAQLEQYTSFAQFWFAWASAYPETSIYHEEK
jgi:hypothetical protein